MQFGALTSGITFDGRAIGATGMSTIVDPLGGTDTLINIEKIGIGGTNFDDIIYGSEHFAPIDAYANQLYGNGGNDQLFGASAQDFLDGGDGNDSIEGGDADDTLIGGAGDDALHGGSADDFLVGDAGNDTIDGGTGADDIATFYLPGTTLGSLRAVDGTGADAGTILIERVDGAEVEVIAKIIITGQGATVQGLGSAAFLGTDTITNVDRLLFSVATADPVSNPYDPDAYAVVQLASGVVSDGYIAGSTVFIDANDNGLLDAGEASTVTDAAGNFTFASASTGTVRAVGGINIDTGLPNLLTLSAPDGSSVINPLTTLVQTIVQQGDGAVSIEQAQGQVLASLGLSPSIDLSNVDILTAAATDPDALAAQRAAVMIATILVGAGEAAGADGAATAITAALQNLAGQVSAPDSQVDLTNSATISAIVTAGLPEGTDANAVITLLGNATQSISTAADVGAIADVQHEAVVALDQTAPNRPSFTLDAESDTGVSHSDRLTADLAPTLRGVAEAGSIVSIYSGNELIGSTVTAANGSWQFTATLAAGVQNLIATATDASGNVSEDASLSFTIDTTAVTLAAPDLDSASDSGRSSSDNVTNDTTPTVRGGGAEAGATVNLYASDGTTVLGSAIADSAGAWSITSSALAAGTHELTVRQSDLAGNVSASSSALRTTIDVAAQAPSIHSPAGTADPTPVISGTTEANASIAIHNAAGVVVGTALANDAGAWSFQLETPLARGQNGFALVATDAAGNVSASVTTTVALVEARNDFNGDGRSDMLWRDDAGQVSNWLATTSGGFNNNAGSVMAMGSDWKVAGTGDFNGDGREDILWRQDGSGTVTEWLANAQGGYAANDAATVRVGLDWHIFGVGDFNGDGRSDILWEQNGGALINWLGKADGSFTSNAANFSTVVGTEWRVVGTSDYNGDGRSDILWRKDGSGQVLNWLATSDGGFNTNGDATVNVGLDWHISGTGDFNGDGIGDILWRQNGGLTIDWLGTSTGVFTSNAANFATVIGTEWRVVGIGDYNGDAIDDLLWRQDGSGHVIDWLGTANGGFQTNAANFDVNVPASMHVQDAFLPFI